MSREEVLSWFQKRLNRPPEAYDVYMVAKDFYQLGAYSRALACLKQYITLPGSAVVGRHLLAYCFLNLGETALALKEFKRCAVDGYHDDWQLVVELTLEVEQKRKQMPSQEAQIS